LITNEQDDDIAFHNASFKWHAPKKVEDKSDKAADSKKDSKASTTINEQDMAPDEEPLSDERIFTLNNVNVMFPRGKLSLIVGPTGSGKTSLLLALLGEMARIEGSITIPTKGNSIHNVSYVAQEAWLRNDTIRNNILFGEEYDEARYKKVLQVCALVPDLDILIAGDQTEIGEKGVTLSGGQKQRLSIARAVYSPSQVVLLADVLSAVDSHTARHIYDDCLTGELMTDRTCILVTHHVSLCLPGASFVTVINGGSITHSGTPQALIEQGILEQHHGAVEQEAEQVNDESNDIGTEEFKKSQVDTKLVDEEERETGSVKMRIV